MKLGWDVFQELRELPFPTTAMVNGFCMGGGVELALACRYRVALDDPKTRFALPEVMLGIMPAWHGVQWLPKLVGPAAALDMMLTGKRGRCAPREAHGARRPGGAAAHPREHRAHGHSGSAPRTKQLSFMNRLMLPARCGASSSSQASKQVAKRARTRALSRALRDPRARGASTTAIRSPRRSDPSASVESLFDASDHDEPDPHLLPAGADEVARARCATSRRATCTSSAPA